MRNEMNALDEEIHQLATSLRIGPNLVANYRGVVNADSAVFLRDLLKTLLTARQRERCRKNRAGSNLPPGKTLEGFETACLELPKGLTMSWLSKCSFIESKQNLVLLGLPGTGKTHLAAALGAQACDQGYKVSFKRMSAFMEELTVAYEAGEFAKLKRKLEQVDLLILDEWGYLPTNVTGTRLLFDVISDCYERRSIILTTNLPLPEWNRIFSEERMLMAMIDRIVHHCYLIKHTGESYRMTHSLMS